MPSEFSRLSVLTFRGNESGFMQQSRAHRSKRHSNRDGDHNIIHSQADVRGKVGTALGVGFESQNLTSCSGLILFQRFLSLVGIKERPWGCFHHPQGRPVYSHHVIMMLLVVQLIIGRRRFRDVEYYRDDEMLKRLYNVRWHPRAQSHSRITDSDNASRARCHSKTCGALVFQRDPDTSPSPDSTRRAHFSPRRQTIPVHEQQRKV